MKTKAQAAAIVAAVKQMYPEAVCSLTYLEPWQLMVAVRLSAQCTDARVNIVTADLFAKYPTLRLLAAASPEEIEQMIKSCGLGKSKARDLSAAARLLVDKYAGRLPNTMEELLSIPGIGRKSANLLLGDVYNLPAIVADTHCIRIANRIGFVGSTDPLKVELALRKAIVPEESSDFCHRLVLHGRAVCTARKAFCENCLLCGLCDTGLKSF